MIKIQVSRADAFVKESETLTSGRIGLQCGFEFSSDWTGLGKTAVFVAGSVVKTAVVSGNNIVEVPWECLENSGINLKVGVYGTNADDDDMIVIPTVWCGIDMILKGTEISGSESAAVTPTLAQQVLANSQSAVSAIITNVTVDDSEAGIVGTPDVTITDTTGVGSRTLKFKFSNLKGATGETGPAGTTTWSGITDKPSTFPPSTHTHAWSAITDKPSTFTPSSHSHVMEDITDLPSIPQSADDIPYGESTVADALTSQSEAITTQATKIATIERTDVLQNRDIEMLKAAAQGKLYVEETDTTSAYTKTVPSGALPYASLDMVGGKTVKWNQLVKDFNGSSKGVTASITDGIFVLSGTATDAYASFYYFKVYENHKYALIKEDITNPNSVNLAIGSLNNNVYCNTSKIVTSSSTKSTGLGIQGINAGTDLTGISIRFFIIDLTDMFGVGNEPETIEEVRKMFPAANYAYNTGTLLSGASDEIQIQGANLVPEAELIDGWYVDGSLKAMSNQGMSSILLRIKENTQYTIVFGMDSTMKRVAYVNTPSSEFVSGYTSISPISFDEAAKKFIKTNNTTNKYLFITYWRNTSTNSKEDCLKNVMVVEGDASEFVPQIDSTTVTIPSEVRALDGYGQSNVDDQTQYNYVDFNEKKYYKKGKYVNGTWTADVQTIDVSAYLTEDFNILKVEGNGSITFHHPNADDGYLIPVTNKITYQTKVV